MVQSTKPRTKKLVTYQEKVDKRIVRALKMLTTSLYEGGYVNLCKEACLLQEKVEHAIRDAAATDKLVKDGSGEDAAPEGFHWQRAGSIALHKGDVLRVRANVRDSASYGAWRYGVCTGSGNGCSPTGPGTGVFVWSFESDFERARRAAKRLLVKDEMEGLTQKWQTSMRIDVLLKDGVVREKPKDEE